MVKCRICGKKFRVISSTHLKKDHHISIKEYKVRFHHANIGFLFSPNMLPTSDPKYLEWKKSLLKRPKPWNANKTKETDIRIRKMVETF